MSPKTPENTKAKDTATHVGVAAIAIGICGFIWWVTGDPSKPPVRQKPSLAQDAVIDAPITLVPADKSDLACSLSQETDGYRCAFNGRADTDTWPDLDPTNAEHRKKMLAPYKTLDDTLFLIPGLFEEPAVAERYADEGPRRLPRDKQDRFTAQCKLKLVKEVQGALVRWAPTGAWQGPHKVWIGEVSECRVSEP